MLSEDRQTAVYVFDRLFIRHAFVFPAYSLIQIDANPQRAVKFIPQNLVGSDRWSVPETAMQHMTADLVLIAQSQGPQAVWCELFVCMSIPWPKVRKRDETTKEQIQQPAHRPPDRKARPTMHMGLDCASPGKGHSGAAIPHMVLVSLPHPSIST